MSSKIKFDWRMMDRDTDIKFFEFMLGLPKGYELNLRNNLSVIWRDPQTNQEAIRSIYENGRMVYKADDRYQFDGKINLGIIPTIVVTDGMFISFIHIDNFSDDFIKVYKKLTQ